MSDHCKTCYYSVKEKVGERACPFNSLYWHFLDRNKERFQKNPRMAFPYKAWQRMDDGVKEGILSQAEKNLKKLNEL
jgi:deoxyribodipyrimidine photolyase-related protein